MQKKVLVSCQNPKYYGESSGSTDRNASAAGVSCQTLCRQLTPPGCEPAITQNGLEKLSLISWVFPPYYGTNLGASEPVTTHTVYLLETSLLYLRIILYAHKKNQFLLQKALVTQSCCVATGNRHWASSTFLNTSRPTWESKYSGVNCHSKKRPSSKQINLIILRSPRRTVCGHCLVFVSCDCRSVVSNWQTAGR